METAKSLRDTVANTTFATFGAQRLRALCRAVAPNSDARALQHAFTRLVEGWGQRRIGHSPRYASHIADDEAPFEFAIAISNGSPEVQFYVEAQGELPTLRSNLAAARSLLELAEAEFEADLRRLRQLEPLLLPEDPLPPFTLWLGVSWAPGRGLRLKAYLNPQVRGRDHAWAVTADALGRLGFGVPWSAFRGYLSENKDEIAIISLDLTSRDDARVKVYVRHHGADLEDVCAIASATHGSRRSDAATFYDALAGCSGPFLDKPLITEIALVERHEPKPSAMTLEFPIGSYVATDAEAKRRVAACMQRFGLSSQAYENAIDAFALRALDEAPPLHAHVTFRRDPQGARIGVYFASDAYIPARRDSSTRVRSAGTRDECGEHGR